MRPPPLSCIWSALSTLARCVGWGPPPQEIRVLTVDLRKVLLADRKTLEAEREAGLSDSDASVPRNGH